MKKSAFALAVVGAALAAGAADIGRVIVRQQWPWSTKINVDFELSGVSASAPADISLRCYNGAAEIPAATVDAALSGSRYALTAGGTYTLTLDPAVLFPSGTKTVPDFRVTVAASAASEKSLEVLYKIVNLESPYGYGIEDVTRAQLLNGEMGAVETDYAALGAKYGATFSTSLEDVCIWTGVTNDVKYKSTHMVLRKIPAKGKTFKFLKGLSGANSGAGYDTSFTNDFYIGVFEVTQTQFKKMKTKASHGDFWETNTLYAAYRPADNLYWLNDLRGTTATAKRWPNGDHTDVASTAFFGSIQSKVGLVFDLPTEAMWEFACRGGTETGLYTGSAYSAATASLIMRARNVNAPDSSSYSDRNCDLDSGSNIVGSYAPNAYGLYDMIGNVSEFCLDRTLDKMPIPEGGVDPRGYDDTATSESGDYRVLRGGGYATDKPDCTTRSRDHQTYNSKSSGFRVCLYPDFSL